MLKVVDCKVNIINSFRNLPVFQVSGKSEGERIRFVEQLMTALEGRSLLRRIPETKRMAKKESTWVVVPGKTARLRHSRWRS